MTSQQAYPLAWPVSWPRTKSHLRTGAPFFTSKRHPSTFTPGTSYAVRGKRSMNDCTDEVQREARAIGAGSVVISTNVELRQDGLPYSNRRAPEDPGAAVYFILKKKPCVLACDKWNRVEDNLWAIAKHIEALRGQERWGVGSVDQAFAGYTALPAPGTSGGATWYQILQVPHDCSFEVAQGGYRALAAQKHPDVPGGSHDAMVNLNAAWDQARMHFGK
jgi:hypothetical protein